MHAVYYLYLSYLLCQSGELIRVFARVPYLFGKSESIRGIPPLPPILMAAYAFRPALNACAWVRASDGFGEKSIHRKNNAAPPPKKKPAHTLSDVIYCRRAANNIDMLCMCVCVLLLLMQRRRRAACDANASR